MRAIAIVLLIVVSLSAKAQTAEDYYNRGNEKTSKQEFEGPIVDYDKAIKINSKFTDAYYNRGSSKLYLKDYKGAIADFDKALEIQPDFIKAYTNRAIAKLKANDLPGAISDFDITIKNEPGKASGYFTRGQVKLQLGDTKGGCADLTKANDLGDSRSQKYLQQYCSNMPPAKVTETQNEFLRLDWPDAEGWKVGNDQDSDDEHLIELLKNNETLDTWTEIGTMISYYGVKNIPVNTAMNMMYEQAKKKCSSAKLTFIEKDEQATHPWIIFKIECSATVAESQVWFIVQGSNAQYVNFRAVKQKALSDQLKEKWVAFFKTGSIVNPK